MSPFLWVEVFFAVKIHIETCCICGVLVLTGSLEEAAYNLVDDSEAGTFWEQSPSDLINTRRPLVRAVHAVLGRAHWVTATCEELLLDALLELVCDIQHGSDSNDDGDEDDDGQDDEEEKKYL